MIDSTIPLNIERRLLECYSQITKIRHTLDVQVYILNSLNIFFSAAKGAALEATFALVVV